MGSQPADTRPPASPSPAAAWSRVEPVMGTVVSIRVHAPDIGDEVRAATDAVLAELRRLEAIFSTFRPDSAISRLNRGELTLADCPPEVADVLDACTWLDHDSDGAFRIEPPGRPGVIDPAGFVKGWASERAAQRLTAAGFDDWYVSVGGDAQTSGSPSPGRPWTAAISAPGAPGAVAMTIEIPPGGAIATSGTTDRGNHLWTTVDRSPSAHSRTEGRAGVEGSRQELDANRRPGMFAQLPAPRQPSSGAPGDPLASMTVIGPRLTWADAFATAAFAMGAERGVMWVARHAGYRAWALTYGGELLASP